MWAGGSTPYDDPEDSMADTDLKKEAESKADAAVDVTDKDITARGLPARELADADLEREVTHLQETRHATFLNGSADSLKAHTERMLELEAEYLRRFPADATPDPLRMRDTSRELDGRGA
jgi:hypothetical protein